MDCVQCKGPYHPATGHYYERWDAAVCGACYRPFVHWVKGMMSRKWAGRKFYEEAATSIRPDAMLRPLSLAALMMFMSRDLIKSRAAARP